MNIFYNFDDMYETKQNKKVILNNTSKKENSNTSDDLYELDKNVALFDYSAKATSSYLTKQSCSNVNCFEGITNPEMPDNCMEYNNCLQYFNTMPIMNCIDNVPAASFLIFDD
jgi:hypothetical protein